MDLSLEMYTQNVHSKEIPSSRHHSSYSTISQVKEKASFNRIVRLSPSLMAFLPNDLSLDNQWNDALPNSAFQHQKETPNVMFCQVPWEPNTLSPSSCKLG
jgi:hypothetical protein